MHSIPFRADIAHTLQEGQTIICSRYAHSGVAYSRTKGLGLDWCRNPDRGLIAPDLLIFLDVDPHKAMERSEYGQERYEKLEFQTKVRESFMELFKCEKQEVASTGGQHTVHVIDASQSIDSVHAQIMQLAQEAIASATQGAALETLWST